MDKDVLQKPTSEILFRQSSVETRLSPVHLSDEESEDEKQEDNTPKIVGCKKKSSAYPEENETISKPLISPKPKTTKGKSNLDERTIDDWENLNNKTENINAVKGSFKTNPSQTKENKEKFKTELNKKLDKPKPTSRNDKINDTQVIENTNINSDLSTVHKSKDPFKDELSKRIEVGLRKKSGPTPPPRVSSVLIGKQESIEGCLQNDANHNTKGEENSDGMKNVQMKFDEQRESVEFSVGTLKALKKNEPRIDKDKDNTVGGAYGEEMATLRPKSPRPTPLKGEKEETIWDKIGTLGRKKRIKEVQEVQAEGKYAIDSPGCPTAPVIPPEDYNLDDNEERCMIDPRAYDDPRFLDLLYVLKEWINDELASQRIIVQDLSEDLYDGQVLQKLLEKLTGDKLDVPEVTQSEEGQKQKLTVVLDHFNKVLGIQRQSHNKWNVESIHSKNIVAITHLLVALARHFRPPVRLPEHVSVEVVVVQKSNGKLFHKTVRESLTKAYDDVGMRCERDAFDTLFDHAPDKLQVVKKSLVTFVNKHLNKMNFEVTEIESQFHDGVYLIMLMGLLEGFFVPHYSFHLTPHEFEQKVQNVNFAFELMEETGLQKPKARPEDVVNMDLKSTLRVLYNLFLRYRTIY